MIRTDIAIIGAGIAGASLAAEIGTGAKVLLIEGESQPGYHSTGRSAAFWSETYGGPAIQPLTSASGDYLRDGGFLHPRGGLHVAGPDGGEALARLENEFAGTKVRLDRIDRVGIEECVPGIRPGFDTALVEASCTDIDVAALHALYLATARRAGATLLCDARVLELTPGPAGWLIRTTQSEVMAGIVVNAAGAWAAEIGAMAAATPIAITPYRRTMVQLVVDPPAAETMPLVMDAAETWYFKPEAGGRIWLSPHDETPSAPTDAAPETFDVAVAIHRFSQVVDWDIVKRERAWAGLRSFAPDRVPVYGEDPRRPGFFWFAGQGGFGIQTAPAAAWIGAALLLGAGMPESLRGVDIGFYGPDRFAARVG
ncbi:MAG: dependent oxidoreductase [Rhizorhabdus sp.]|nr:dependent oxidoreductase [Rhizorhabdus sp.]